MRERARDILGIKPLVEIDRGIDALHDIRWAARQPAAPRGVGGYASGLAQCRRPDGLPVLRHGAAWAKPMINLMRALTVVLLLCPLPLGALVYDRSAPKPAPAAPAAASRQPEAAGGGEFSLLNPPRPAAQLGFTARNGTPNPPPDFRGRV